MPRLLPSGTLFAARADGRAIRCFRCGATSWHPQDVAERYCPMCHVFHADPVPIEPGELAKVFAELLPGACVEVVCVGCQMTYLTGTLPLACRCGHVVALGDYS